MNFRKLVLAEVMKNKRKEKVMRDIEKRAEEISNLSKWNVDDVGRLYVLQTVYDKIQRIEGNDAEPLVDDVRYKETLKGFKGSDWKRIGEYEIVAELAEKGFSNRATLTQQFFNGINLHQRYLRDCDEQNKLQKVCMDNMPLMITEEMYQFLKNRAIDIRKNRTESLWSLMDNVLYYCMTFEPDKAPEPIKKELDALSKQTATNGEMIETFLSYLGDHWYELAGTELKSTDYESEDAWDEAVKKEVLATFGEPYKDYINKNYNKLYDRVLELYFHGIPAIEKEFKKLTGRKPTEKQAQTLLDDLNKLTNGQLIFEGDSRAKKVGNINIYDILRWKAPVIYQHTVEGQTVNKLSLIQANTITYFSNSSADAQKKKAYKAFRSEYKELYKLLKEYIQEHIPQTRGLTVSEHFKPIISWGELEQLDFIGNTRYDCTDVSSCDIIEEYTELTGLPKNPTSLVVKVEEVNNCNVENINNELEKALLDSKHILLEDIENNEAVQKDLIEYINDLCLPAAEYSYAYNALVDILEDVFDLPEIEVAKMPVKLMESIIKQYNKTLYNVYFRITGNKQRKVQARKSLKRFFKPIDCEDLKPTAKQIAYYKHEIQTEGLADNYAYSYYLEGLRRESKLWATE